MPHLLIGIDEAGLAPNLGPLVITATLWELPCHIESHEIWRSFADVLTNTPARNDPRLHIADSKKVHQPHKGIRGLERGVLSSLRTMNLQPENVEELWAALSPEGRIEFRGEPWNIEQHYSVPLEADPVDIEFRAQRWKACCCSTGIQLKNIRSEVVSTARYNRLVEQYQNKSLVLSKLSLGLLRTFWNPHSDDHCLIISDKHGGRNRYDYLLREVAGEESIECEAESTPCSTYRVRNTELRFQVGGEEHLPVALASMISKYVREASLAPFNDYFCRRIPGLQPTKGYPVDAARFRAEVQQLQRELGIPDHQFWRSR